MKDRLPVDAIHVNDVNLWAHVGLLESERKLGQWFNLDFSILADLDKAAKDDDVNSIFDYSVAIKELQKLSFRLNCMTIEHYCEKALDCLELLYGSIPMRVKLSKCDAPVSGFTGTVAVERFRYWHASCP